MVVQNSKSEPNPTIPASERKARDGRDFIGMSGLVAYFSGILFTGTAWQAGGVVAALSMPVVGAIVAATAIFCCYYGYQGAKLLAEAKSEKRQEQQKEAQEPMNAKSRNVTLSNDISADLQVPGPTPIASKRSTGRSI